MDSKNLKPELSFLSNPKRFRETCMPQEFLIPMPIMKYIWTNPSSPKVYQKLIQCCKIFFIKNPILVIKNLLYRYYETKKWGYCNKTDCNRFIYQHCPIDVDRIKVKIWVTRFQVVNKGSLSNFILIFPKLFRQEFEKLDIQNEKLSYNELLILSKGVKKFWIYSDVRYENGELVPLENIIRIFSKNTKVYNCTRSSNLVSFKKYDDFVDACNAVKEVVLHHVPDDFDVSEFYQHLKNKKSRAVIKIFSGGAHYNKTAQVVDEMLSTEFFDFVPPVIYHASLNAFKVQKMCQIHEIQAQKYQA